MKRQLAILLTSLGIALALPCLTGCGTTTPKSKPIDHTFPSAMAEKLARLSDCGGIVVIGASDSSTVQVAEERAQMKARTLIARTIKDELGTIRTSVIAGLAEDVLPTPYATLFEAAIQNVTTTSVHSPIILETTHKSAGYRTAAWALAVHSPDVIKELIMRQVGEDADARAQIEESTAMRKLEKRIDTFDARKRREGWQTEIEKLRIGE